MTSNTPSTEPANEPTPGKPSWIDGFSGSIRKVALWAAGIVGGAVLAFYVQRTLDPPAPLGEVAVSGVERNVTRSVFLGSATEPQPGETLGLVIAVERKAENRTSGCSLRWSFYDADGPRRLSEPMLVDQPAQDISGDRDACTTPARLWVPLDERIGEVQAIQVEIDLYAGDDHLDSAFTPTVPLG